MAATDTTGLTNELLEKALSLPVEKFEIKAGSDLGDGYTCVLHSVSVWPKNVDKDNPLNIVIKGYPVNPGRQAFLESSNIFKQELGVYEEIIPELYNFQESLNLTETIAPPFGKFIYGSHVNMEDSKTLGRPLHFLDNSIIMPDLRTPENGGYRLRDRFLGLDLDHYNLVIEAQARLHALSWAYKQHKKISSLSERFSFLEMSESQLDSFRMWGKFVAGAAENARVMYKDQAHLLSAIDVLEKRFMSILGLYMGMELGQAETGFTKDSIVKRPNPPEGAQEPWLVLLHGDAWSNNMMFRYDEKNGKPVQVLFVDLQLTREGDPLADIVYTLYCSTNGDLRTKHLTSMLHVYYDTFTRVCKRLSVPTLPGFTWKELNRRFRHAKIHGAAFALLGLPMVLKNPEELVDLEEVKFSEGGTAAQAMDELFQAISVPSSSANPLLELRLKEVLQDMVEDEIL